MPSQYKNKTGEQFFYGKTFDDFLIRPQLGIAEHRDDISLQSKFSRNITLNLPIVSANMDTVTGPDMCIAMAQLGGIGILPRSSAISIDEQLTWVRKVKRAENFIIEQPYSIDVGRTMGEAFEEMKRKKVGTLLVVNRRNQLKGALIYRDARICLDLSDPISQWMIRGKGLKFSKRIIKSPKQAWEALRANPSADKLPLVDKDMRVTGLITAKDISSLLSHTLATKDEDGQLRVGVAIGAVGNYMERAEALIEDGGVDVIVIDTAHAHSTVVLKAIERFRKKFPYVELVAGNVATAEAAKELLIRKIDGIKVGIGAGFGCRTRLETSFGVPQLQSVREVWSVVRNKIPIISDGGVKNFAHVAMAALTGASSVMLGGMLAGTDESPGSLIRDPATGSRFKIYRGMTSPEAKLAAANGDEREIKNVEGQTQRIAYKGSVKDILKSMKHALQSAVSYAGEKDLASARAKISRNPKQYLISLSESSKKESFER